MLSHLMSVVARNSLARIFMALLIAFAAMAPAEAASVPRKFAGIVVDAKSGKVLYESAADAARYPASVTKVMTLYVLFQELSAGNISLSDKMTVSKHAASAVPTKLGLKAGSKITVENAIKALVTLSANDMARVIAEHISGTESKFAERMTATARALGMSRTTYRNASGLPDSKQITTVRDQAILGSAVYQHFPKYYEYFQTRSSNASGFNLLTAARTDGRHIIVVGFGFDTSGSRDAKVRELVRTYVSKGRSGGYLDVAMIPQPGRKGATVQVASTEPSPVTPLPYPAWRLTREQVQIAATEVLENEPEIIAASTVPVPAARPTDLGIQQQVVPMQATAAISSVAPSPRDRPLDVIGAWLSDTFQLGAEPAPLGQTAPSAPLLPPVGIGDAGEPIDLMTSGSIGQQPVQVASIEAQPMPAPLAPAAEPASGGTWIVQIGAAPTEAGASNLIAGAASNLPALGSMKSYVERFEKSGQVFYRARFAGFDGRDDATAMCNELKKAKMSCLAMQS
ncbi:MAG: D-alanyl-D-alanine carboxypeptidase [Hyphomicrobiales bacterium]|nr:MAG: D-alanyl-D-alanine carboxypeptidase [Hyphomicrobiales bacterium]